MAPNRGWIDRQLHFQPMDDKQLLRYSRHILLPQIDIEGQERLLRSHALLVGAGGLGSPAALYLASAGVGQLTICDGDVVDLTNLQRQIVHRESAIGMNKALSARKTLKAINQDCLVTAISERVGESALMKLVAEADVVLDGSDNFPTRHAVNRACVAHSKPLVSGAAIQFAGQLSVFDTRQADAPCYNCLYPESLNAAGERCATMGVFAPLTGMIGALQAGEAIRLILGETSTLTGQLVLFEANGMEWQKIRVQRDPDCTVCGPNRA